VAVVKQRAAGFVSIAPMFRYNSPGLIVGLVCMEGSNNRMLMDRKRIERWWRWVALFLAVVFLFSFVLLGVGSSSAGNVLMGCEEQESVTEDSYFSQQEKFYLGLLAENPADTVAMVALGGLYSSEGIGRYTEGIELYNRAIATDPNNIPARLALANLNMTLLGDSQEALRILGEAAAIAPDDPKIFLQQGLAAKQVGENAIAIVAWNRFLVLSPDDPVADTLRSEISLLETLPPVPVEAPAPEVTE
jgi:tetratricopeptide (TPR) repeat protein